MKTRPFGPRGVSLPVIGQGTWEIERSDRQTAITALRTGIDLGMTHIDTAEMYGSGKAEEIVGEAVQGIRDRLYIVSKVLPSNASYDRTIKACERSLERLGTDRLDLYLLHWRGGTPLRETFRAFNQLQKDGKILEWGVSNFDAGDLAEGESVAGKGKIACNQVLYHIDERAIEHSVLPWCTEHGVPIVAYSPFGSGRFPSPSSKGGKKLKEIAEARGVTPRQLALAYVVRNGHVYTIPKAARVDHVRENAAAGDLALSNEEVAAIDEAFPRGRPRGLPMI